jgi:hypothetical protein
MELNYELSTMELAVLDEQEEELMRVMERSSQRAIDLHGTLKR